jgi:hypothetical protein
LDRFGGRFCYPRGNTLATSVARNRCKRLRLDTGGLPENFENVSALSCERSYMEGPPTKETLSLDSRLETSGIEAVGGPRGGLYYAHGPFRPLLQNLHQGLRAPSCAPSVAERGPALPGASSAVSGACGVSEGASMAGIRSRAAASNLRASAWAWRSAASCSRKTATNCDSSFGSSRLAAPANRTYTRPASLSARSVPRLIRLRTAPSLIPR